MPINALMQVGHFPASAASSLIQGYCDDFVSLATILAQTLEQVSMRGISLDHSRPPLERIEKGMRDLADAIHELLGRGHVPVESTPTPAKEGKAKEPAPAPAASAPHQAPRSGSPVRPAHPAVHPPAAARPPLNRPAGAAPPPRLAPPAAHTAHAPPLRPAPARPAPTTEALRGTSQSMPLLSVFQFLGRMRKAGTMRVQLGNETLVFELQNGCMLAATSDGGPREENLAELLVEHGTCSREQLAPILAKVDAAAPERFAQLTIQAGLVKTEQAIQVLEVQARRRLTRACKASDAAYEFVEGTRPAAESGLRIPPMAIA